MFNVTPAVWAALGDTDVVTETAAVALYRGNQTELDVLQTGQVSWDADGDVQATSSVHVIGHGDSLVPHSQDAVLAPFGQEVRIVRRLYIRDDVIDIPLGIFRITANNGGRESSRDGRVLDWEVGVELSDRFRMIARAKIVSPASPPQGASAYSELQRLVLFPVVVDPSVPDVAAPRSLVYDNRMDGVHALAEALGGKPRLTRQGALTVRPADRWAWDTTIDFDLPGEIGTSSGQTDEFYNYVWTHNDKGEFSQFAAITDDGNPLSINRAGISSYEHSSPFYVSDSASRHGAQTILARLQARRSRTVDVLLDARGLLLELSDLGWVRDAQQNRAVLGEVSKITVPHDPTARIKVELIVAEEN